MTEHFDEIHCNKLIISSENGRGLIALGFDDGSPYVMLINKNAKENWTTLSPYRNRICGIVSS